MIEPALPRQGTACEKSISDRLGSIAAEPGVGAVMIPDRASMAARYDHHRAVLGFAIVEHDADRCEIVIGDDVARIVHEFVGHPTQRLDLGRAQYTGRTINPLRR